MNRSKGIAISLMLAATTLLDLPAFGQSPNPDNRWPVPAAGGTMKSGTNVFVFIKGPGIVMVGSTFSITNDAGVFEFRLKSSKPDGIRCDRLKATFREDSASRTDQVQPDPDEKAGSRNPFDTLPGNGAVTSRVDKAQQPDPGTK